MQIQKRMPKKNTWGAATYGTLRVSTRKIYTP